MNSRKLVLLSITVLIIALQFIPRAAPNQSKLNGPTDISNVVHVPQQVQTVLKTSCYDCHSNNSRYPWYARFQPFRYTLDKHIREGRNELNFSEFGTYSPRKRRNKLRAMATSIEEKSMPLYSYTLIHRDAELSEASKILLLKWLSDSRDSLD